MAFKIYTKTGDQGKTSLIGGTKVPKSHIRIESYGTIDELNCYIGLVRDVCGNEAIGALLRIIQDRLFTIGSSLACDPEKEPKMKIPDLKEEDVVQLEKAIDQMTQELPEMKSFILPGGHTTISYTQIARCMCRRVERLCVALHESGEYVEPLVIIYLNRLSDYLFTLARYFGLLLGVADIPWRPRIS